MILLRIAVGFVLGVVAGSFASLPLFMLAALFLGAMILAWRLPQHARLILPLAGLLLGLARAPHGNDTSTLTRFVGQTIQVHGQIAAEPNVRKRVVIDDLDVDQLTVGGRTVGVTGRLEFDVSPSVQLEAGEEVTALGRLRPPFSFPGLLGGPAQTRGVAARMAFPAVRDEGPGSGLRALAFAFRHWLANGIDAWLPEPQAALLVAITLGARSSTLGPLTASLTQTGLIHIVAISGIKVALVAGTLYELAALTRRRRLAPFLALLGLWGYVFLTGFTVSGVRSALMWSLVFAAVILGRRTVALVSLSVVAALMLALDPTLIWDIGFLLSTVGTASIVAFSPPLLSAARCVPSPFRETLCVTIAAQAGTLVIVAVGFGVLSLSGPIANAIFLPFLPLLISLGLALGALAGVPILAAPLAAAAVALLHFLLLTVSLLASWPLALPAPAVSALPSVLYYGVLIGLAFLTVRSTFGLAPSLTVHRGREWGMAVGVTCLALTVGVLPGKTSSSGLLWLGSGNSLLLRSGSNTVLIDGSAQPLDLLTRLGAVLPAGDRRIDILVVTAPTAANALSLQQVVQRYRVGEVLDVGAEYPTSAYGAFRAELRARRIPDYALRTGVAVRLPQVTLEALGPDAVCPQPAACAGLLRVEGAHRSILLPGASNQREQQEAVFRPIHLRSQVVLAPGPLDANFVRAVGARSLLRPQAGHQLIVRP